MASPKAALGQLQVLSREKAQVPSRRGGRATFYSAAREGLRPIGEWMHRYAQFWDERFDALEGVLKELDSDSNQIDRD